jgi:hypothetical protein
MAIRKGQRTLPKGTEAHAKRYVPPKVSSRSSVPSVSHRATIPGKQGPKGK